MKKSKTPNKDMTVEEVIKLLVYRPYYQDISFMVDKEERIHFKGNNWMVTLNHKTGEFHFTGEIHKYYEIDTVTSIRDCFGEIYSLYNVMYKRIPVDTWITVKDEIKNDDVYFRLQDEEKKELREKRLQYQRDYYYNNKVKWYKEKRKDYEYTKIK